MKVRGCGRRCGAQHHQTGGTRGCFRFEIFRGIGFEFIHATGAAKVVVLPAVLVEVFGGRGIYFHSANGVAFEGGRRVGGLRGHG